MSQEPLALVTPMRRVLRWGALVLVGSTPAVAGIGYLAAERAGLLGALVGWGIAVAFLGGTAAMALVTARMSPTALGAIVLGSWLVKVAVLIAILAGLRAAEFYDRTAFGISLLIGIVATLALEAIIVVRTRVPYLEPNSSTDSPNSP